MIEKEFHTEIYIYSQMWRCNSKEKDKKYLAALCPIYPASAAPLPLLSPLLFLSPSSSIPSLEEECSAEANWAVNNTFEIFNNTLYLAKVYLRRQPGAWASSMLSS